LFEYVYGSDLNGDNSASNDLLYVPTNAHDTTQIRFSTSGSGATALTPAQQQDLLENFISSHPCLNSQRGTIMKRNSCRTPWDKVEPFGSPDAADGSGQNFILQLDIFNFLNRSTRTGARATLAARTARPLTRRCNTSPRRSAGQDHQWRAPVFNYNVVNQFNTQNPQSNYALQLQLKYQF
jgi:hypothetical protein